MVYFLLMFKVLYLEKIICVCVCVPVNVHMGVYI